MQIVKAQRTLHDLYLCTFFAIRSDLHEILERGDKLFGKDLCELEQVIPLA